jgi:hypothetical protein
MTGCVRRKAADPVFTPFSGEPVQAVQVTTNQDASPRVIVTPETGLIGKVASLNASGQFVVLTFPVGHMPAEQQRLNVYRHGLKVGELVTTRWQLDDHAVADIMAGEAQVGDEVRDK